MSRVKALRPANSHRSEHATSYGIKSSRRGLSQRERTRALYNQLQEVYADLYGTEQRTKHNLILSEILIWPEDRVLDVGCGDGQLVNRLVNLAAFVVGLDISTRMIAQASKLLHHAAKSDLVIGDFDYLPFRKASIQRLTAVTTILDALQSPHALSEIRRVISATGTSIISHVAKARNSESMIVSIRRVFREGWSLREIRLDNDLGILVQRVG